MTQPARRFDLWRRLYTRFLIEPLPAQEVEPPAVGTLVTPVTQADELLKVHKVVLTTMASFDAGGVQDGAIVPAGKRWTLFALRFSLSSGNRTAINWILYDASEDLFQIIRVFTAALEDTFLLPSPITMEELDIVRLNFSGGSTATVPVMNLWVAEEDAF